MQYTYNTYKHRYECIYSKQNLYPQNSAIVLWLKKDEKVISNKTFFDDNIKFEI